MDIAIIHHITITQHLRYCAFKRLIRKHRHESRLSYLLTININHPRFIPEIAMVFPI